VIDNRSELEQVLRGGLGPAFVRHAYGMRKWVDLFSARIPEIEDPYLTELVAGIVLQNARHARMFRERAIAHGIEPDTYVCPPEGEVIYERMPLDLDETLEYALGSLEHFADLLAVYAEVAASPADNDRAIAQLRELVGHDATSATATAHELYRVRELAEAPLYAYRH